MTIDGAAPAIAPEPEKSADRTRGYLIPIGDQMVSTLGNFVIAVIAARLLSRTEFGAFSLAFTVFILVVGVCRGTLGHIVLSPVAKASDNPADDRGAATGAAFLVGCGGGIITAAIGVSLGGLTGSALIAMGILLPALTVQDTYRYCFISESRPGSALVNDTVWLLLIVPTVALSRHLFGTSVVTLIVAWGVPGAIAALLGSTQGRCMPHLRNGIRWVQDNRRLALPYMGESLSVSGSQQVALLALASVAGIAAVGAVRGVFILFGPLTVFQSGVFVALIPDANRLRDHPRLLGRRIMMSGAVMFITTAVWAVVWDVVPTDVGQTVLGATWTSTKPLILAAGLGAAVSGAMVGSLAGLRALRASRYSFRARIWSFPAMILFSLSFAALWGASGFVWGSSVESCITFTLVAVGFHLANATRGEARGQLHRSRSDHVVQEHTPKPEGYLATPKVNAKQ